MTLSFSLKDSALTLTCCPTLQRNRDKYSYLYPIEPIGSVLSGALRQIRITVQTASLLIRQGLAAMVAD